MTEPNQTNTEDEYYTDAQDNFPSKFDFEDRLVAIWPTGKTGEREGENGKPYPWIETVTVALDDGPDGDKGVGLTSDREEFLVGPAGTEDAIAWGIQWSATGVYSRVFPKLGAKLADGTPDYRPVVGRINRRKNAKKGLADSWSLGKPTDADREILRARLDVIKRVSGEVKAKAQAAEDTAAFSD
jgi:hypothetical protein